MPPTSRETILELLHREGRRIHSLLTRLTLSEDAAEDLMQELFLRLNRAKGFAKAQDQTAYAIRSATNLAFEWHRKQRQVGGVEVEPISELPEPPEILERKEQYEQVIRALGEMSPLARQVIVLSRLESNSYECIAAQIGKTPHQVRAIASKAIRQLKKVLHVPSK